MRTVSQILSEIVLIITYPISGIIVRLIPYVSFEASGEGKTILIVERWLTLNVRHLYWKYYLQRKGFRVIIKNLQLWKRDFSDSARVLERFIDEEKLDDIILVGISSGALTSLLYLEEQGGWDRVDKFIAIGAPFQGTWAAIFLLWMKSGWELLPGSRFLKTVATMRVTHPKQTLCIRARWDEMVPFGATLPGVREVVIPVMGHNNLHIRVRATYRTIVKFAK